MPVDRIESAIEKLTAISNDLKTIIAVHDQRINQQEKETMIINDTIEKRREELNTQLKDVYNTMRTEDSKIITELTVMRKEANDQHKTLSYKISQLEKYVWMAVGAGFLVSILTSHGYKIVNLLK